MIKPRQLHKGDTVGVIAPASPPDLNRLEKAISFLESLGVKVELGSHLSDTYGYLAGKDDDRLADLHYMFENPEIKAVISAGGGYGTSRIAGSINYRLIENNPKIFWGYSDLTFLHTAIRQKTGLITFHGPMLCSDVGKENFDSVSKQMFDQLFHPQELRYSEDISPLVTVSEGKAAGEIVGGNLSLLVNSLGTPYELDTNNRLLFIEDIGEEPYRIDSFLCQLQLAGKLEEAAGVIIGDFSDSEPVKRRESLPLEEVWNHYFASLEKPVVSGFKMGHCLPHFAIPLGAEAELCAYSQTLSIEPGVTGKEANDENPKN
ncbi:LD-carboxypeptidase [Halobacillus rhizosphaerae]|uniref:S66 peptidase family protein n=1 Tax=Halobacillus rhizosphaerae TaxID=3064889 RepID=UPI00398B5E5E